MYSSQPRLGIAAVLVMVSLVPSLLIPKTAGAQVQSTRLDNASMAMELENDTSTVVSGNSLTSNSALIRSFLAAPSPDSERFAQQQRQTFQQQATDLRLRRNGGLLLQQPDSAAPFHQGLSQ